MMQASPYLITVWCGVPRAYACRADGTLATERLAEMRDAGITLLSLEDCGTAINRAALAWCHDNGVLAMLSDGRAMSAPHDAAHRRELLTAVVNDYADCPALLGYYITDEPSSAHFPAIAETLRILRELDPAHEAYVNIFPNYANTRQLGNETYEQHLAEYLDTVQPTLLSYDHYHLIREKAVNTHTLDDQRQNDILHDAFSNRDRAGFFDNLEQVRAACEARSTPFMLIVLLTEHGPYRCLTESEIRYEVFQALAYGSERISYFTYWTPPYDDVWHWKNGMITADGERTPHYEDVRRVNRHLQTLGSALAHRRPTAIHHVGQEPDRLVTYWQGAHGAITALRAEQLTVSHFPDGYLLLASKNYKEQQEVSLTPAEGMSVERCDPETGAWSPLPLQNNAITLTLAAGDAALLRTTAAERMP